MRRVAILSLVVVVLAVAFSLRLVQPVMAGPFGLRMGMKPEEVEEVGGKLEKIDKPEVYRAEVPKPHSAFEYYGLLFGPTTGLCRIKAMGKNVATSAYGTELKNTFDNLEERLKTQYGKNKRYDFLKAGSPWKEPRHFMMGLLKNEHVLSTFWTAKDGSTLTDNLVFIHLQAVAQSQEQGYISVTYEFQNITECQKERKAAEKERNAAEDDTL